MLKDHSFQPNDEFSVEIRALNKEGGLCVGDEAVENPRLLVNVPANKMFIEVTKTTPPYVILIARADQEIQALGLLEKCKDLIKNFVSTLNPVKKDLQRGVKEALAVLSTNGRKI